MEITSIFNQFLNDEVIEFGPYGNGHINDTYLIVCTSRRYILQRINTNVFKEPEHVMHNIDKVTSFLKHKTTDQRSVLNLIKTKNNTNFYIDEQNNYWRLFDFVEESICLELPETNEDFYQAAVAFGTFQRNLTDFNVEELFETIPNFHNTEDRFQKFMDAVEKDICHRASSVLKEIEFVMQRKDFCSVLKDKKLPLRVTHNDTKINNVMLDQKTRSALCVIDLDTIMPGYSVNDFGDSIRSGASTGAEDEKDLSKIWMNLELFEIYAKGFIEGCGGLLTNEEILALPEGAKLMTFECGMRFLTDYLQGDTYFKTKYETHDLDRCRTQFKLVEDMESKWEKMKEIVKTAIN